MARLRRAWFTTFNFDIEFFETFVLPATIGAEPPRNRLEFEQMQQELIEKNIDLRVFCDPRFMDTNRVKRTCVPVHAIRPDRLSQRFSERSLFHPKIIYLEDEKGRIVIGAGSANLTLSGWGRNLEAFVFREVKSSYNYNEIRKFFNQLSQAADIDSNAGKLRERRSLTKVPEKWRFVHSLQNTSFASQLLAGLSDPDLVIWSPYLPRNLAAFISKLQRSTANDKLRVHLVPDRIQNKFLRTEWSEDLAEIIRTGQLTFYTSPVDRDPRAELCHAKIWKVGKALAVGSWNFTGPGSNNLSDDVGKWSSENNVEAGFIIDDTTAWSALHGNKLDLGADDCAPADLLADEILDVADLPPFDLNVTFDWHAQIYLFSGAWLGKKPRENFAVRLPGVEVTVPLIWTNSEQPAQPSRIRINDSALMRDRVFQVLQNDVVVYRGIVSEINLNSRRSLTFNSLKDLLEALILGDDPKSLTDLPLRGPIDCDGFPDDAPGDPQDSALLLDRELSVGSSISYFRLFKSMNDYRAKLGELDKLEQLDKLVFVLPGCLLELVEKTLEALQVGDREIFNWFLGNEVAANCKEARRVRRKLGRGASEREPGYTPAPKSRWDRLEISLPISPSGVAPEYLAVVKRQSNYE